MIAVWQLGCGLLTNLGVYSIFLEKKKEYKPIRSVSKPKLVALIENKILMINTKLTTINIF